MTIFKALIVAWPLVPPTLLRPVVRARWWRVEAASTVRARGRLLVRVLLLVQRRRGPHLRLSPVRRLRRPVAGLRRAVRTARALRRKAHGAWRSNGLERREEARRRASAGRQARKRVRKLRVCERVLCCSPVAAATEDRLQCRRVRKDRREADGVCGLEERLQRRLVELGDDDGNARRGSRRHDARVEWRRRG